MHFVMQSIHVVVYYYVIVVVSNDFFPVANYSKTRRNEVWLCLSRAWLVSH